MRWSTAPVGFDAEDHKNRNVVERAFNKLKTGADTQPDTTSTH
jgi:hypothetical protein